MLYNKEDREKMNLKEGLLEIYRNFCRDRGASLPLMIIFIATNIAFGSLIILYSFEGIMAWLIVSALICGWAFFIPAVVYLIDCYAKERVYQVI